MDVALPTFSEPLIERQPRGRRVPVIFTSPHSGRDYPPAFLAETRLDPQNLRRSEDCFVDELFAAAPDAGAVLLAARFPRAYCDANREQWELDPAMFADALPAFVNQASPRVAAGLGTIPRIVAADAPIYRQRLAFAEAAARIETCWIPFHRRLAALIAQIKAAFGACLLIDCHSMPNASLAGLGRIDVVLGDAHGTTCAAEVTGRIEAAFAERGFIVRRNAPYAGGFITRHYGHPRDGVHAVQIELARRLYMDETQITRSADFSRLQETLSEVIAMLAHDAMAMMAADTPPP
jgi:N-formylglutamate deformylase